MGRYFLQATARQTEAQYRRSPDASTRARDIKRVGRNFTINTRPLFFIQRVTKGSLPPDVWEAGSSARDGTCAWRKGARAYLRAIDVKILQQLAAVNEGIEAVKWLLEEKGALTSRCSSLTSSQYSLGGSQETSRRGSWASLQDPNDRLDSVSIGSYLDTLADELDEYSQHTADPRPGAPLARFEQDWAVVDPERGPAGKAGSPGAWPEPSSGAGAAVAGGAGSRRGKAEAGNCKPGGKVRLEYDAHWRWVQSQDDVTFL
ncbi:PREDICTED: leucine rich adaptor protein 1 [Gavialis gangeticus]|uniref:leucine rich adaptor protein 1 n=1 Tax=Gavialis gangeticus TaxID=94835 RepID=UPI00092F6CE3|nr:PREDICTED: leucine rich adaptor protein 1 [Gavialis gangeticus]